VIFWIAMADLLSAVGVSVSKGSHEGCHLDDEDPGRQSTRETEIFRAAGCLYRLGRRRLPAQRGHQVRLGEDADQPMLTIDHRDVVLAGGREQWYQLGDRLV